MIFVLIINDQPVSVLLLSFPRIVYLTYYVKMFPMAFHTCISTYKDLLLEQVYSSEFTCLW